MKVIIVEKLMRQKVRLGDSDVYHIVESFKQHFGKDDHLWLFGSRVDLERQGGDIDLYIETQLPSVEAAAKETKFFVNLWRRMGEQKIDVVLHVLSESKKLPIYEVAKVKGVQLV